MSPEQFWLKAAEWGSYMRSGDPGACMYGFNERGVVQSEAHRADCLAWLRNECWPHARPVERIEINRMMAYLRTAEVARP